MRVFLVILLMGIVTKATMNVGTFWFTQNNGKFLRKLPRLRQEFMARIPKIPVEDTKLDLPVEEVRSPFQNLWWDDFRKWSKVIKMRKCKYIEYRIYAALIQWRSGQKVKCPTEIYMRSVSR